MKEKSRKYNEIQIVRRKYEINLHLHQFFLNILRNQAMPTPDEVFRFQAKIGSNVHFSLKILHSELNF